MVGKLFMFCGVPHYNTMYSSQVFFLEMFFCSIQYGVKTKKGLSQALWNSFEKQKLCHVLCNGTEHAGSFINYFLVLMSLKPKFIMLI